MTGDGRCGLASPAPNQGRAACCAPLIHHAGVETNATLRAFRDALAGLEEGLATWCLLTQQRLAEICINEGDFDPDQPVLFPLSEFWQPALLEAAGNLGEQMEALSVAIGPAIMPPAARAQPRRRFVRQSCGASTTSGVWQGFLPLPGSMMLITPKPKLPH